jgi:hypothetical protein
MPHRELLTESQRLSLQAPASDERGMVRHYTLSSEDLALINRRRGDPNRLGFALMLCYLHFPGRILQQGEQPPAALCAFVAEQLGLDAAHFGDYAERDQTRREHALEIENRGRDKEGFAPPTEPDWHISCIRLSSWWLAFKKIGVPQCALVLRRTSPPRRSRYLAIGSDLFLWPGLFASSGA